MDQYINTVQELQNGDASVVRGVKCNSVFNSLTFFHVCQPGLPPCIGHDLFEGVVASDLAIYLTHFVKVKKLFTYSQINEESNSSVTRDLMVALNQLKFQKRV